MPPAWSRRIAVCVVLAAAASAVRAGPQAEVLSTDLAPLIERSASDPNRFAVEVPHAVSLTSHGEWSTSGGLSVWRYSLRIPTAVSMSFHARPVYFPNSAQLRVTAGGAVYVYGAKDVNRGELWSRIARGDALALEISVAATDLPQLRFSVAGFQAGYRGLGGGVPNHPHYDKLRQRVSQGAQASSSCQENWACHADSVNSGAGQAAVAIVIGNVGQCTGVLLNDVPGDGTPYVLTARHCENGDADGGAPGAASSLSVYWDAVVPCGTPLGTIYDPADPAQFGATTVVEQQDAWLVKLDSMPVADDAYYAGWDATGATFVGGFTPHHALGMSRQYIGWYGQASYNVVPGSSLGVGFTSTLWATVNAIGSAGGGASGSGVFDANAHLTGIIVRGAQVTGNEAGVCPVSSPPAPSLQTATSLSTALSGIFSSTDDPNSTTGPLTIQSVLDPGHTGTTVVDGQPAPPSVSLLSFVASSTTGNVITLQWTSSRATSCIASGGESGDGWSGPIALRGSAQVTSYDGGAITYSITCSKGSQTAVSQVQVNWALSAPNIDFYASTGRPAYGTPFQLSWRANLRPCTASSGNPGDGWSGVEPISGTTTVVETVVGAVTYTLTCGSGSRTTSVQVNSTILAPSVQVAADAVTLLVGQSVQIVPSTVGLPCMTSGGSGADGWLQNATFNAPVSISEGVPGTYTYAVTCGSGGQTATGQASVTFVNAAPSVMLTASATSVASLTEVTFGWDANVRPCLFSVNGPLSQVFSSAPTAPHASWQDSEQALGDYTYTIACGGGANAVTATKTVTYTGTPVLNVFEGPYAAIAGQPFLVQYLANLAPCVLTGGAPGDGWSGTLAATHANIYVQETSGGSYTYTATCGTGSQSRQAQTTIAVAAAPPTVVMSVDKTVTSVGQPVTITWSSNVSPCVASGGSPGDGWGGSVATSGSQTVSETTRNSYYYGVSCGAIPLNATSSVSVNFLPFGPPSLQASPTSAEVGQAVTLTWSSVDGSTCEAYGGTVTDAWAGNRDPAGSFQLRETVAGTYTYGLACGAAPQSSVMISFSMPPPVPLSTPPPSVQLSANVATTTAGTPVTLTWTAANADSCTAGGGSSSDKWSGALSPSGGSQAVSESGAGTYSYSITCFDTSQSASATSTTTINVSAAPTVTVTGNSSGSSGGGGGLTWLELAFLAWLAKARRRSKGSDPGRSKGSDPERVAGGVLAHRRRVQISGIPSRAEAGVDWMCEKKRRMSLHATSWSAIALGISSGRCGHCRDTRGRCQASTEDHVQERLGLGRSDQGGIPVPSWQRSRGSGPHGTDLSPGRSRVAHALLRRACRRAGRLAAARGGPDQGICEQDPDLRLRRVLTSAGNRGSRSDSMGSQIREPCDFRVARGVGRPNHHRIASPNRRTTIERIAASAAYDDVGGVGACSALAGGNGCPSAHLTRALRRLRQFLLQRCPGATEFDDEPLSVERGHPPHQILSCIVGRSSRGDDGGVGLGDQGLDSDDDAYLALV